VKKAKVHITDGDIFQIVLARSAKIECSDPVKLYRKLRSINPSPYTYLFEFGDLSIVGASPETLFNTYDRKLRVNPIAGTCPRGRTREEDDKYAKIMLGDEKERAEHVMLVDLGRNDVRSVCRSGTVQMEDFMSVLKYSHVQHIQTTVSGALRDECDQFDAARSVFPAGTLSGAPKLRAMEIIDDLEESPRGIYGGGIGYFSIDGSTDFAIAIRSVLVKDGVATVQAGAGIVADSDPLREYEETERKMAAMKRALGVAV
jgi:anthranilate synthase component 1